jgi:hypothetical protein
MVFTGFGRLPGLRGLTGLGLAGLDLAVLDDTAVIIP